MKIFKVLLILSLFSGSAHADFFGDIENWVEGAAEDTGEVIEAAFNASTDWMSHNPGLTMGIAVIATTVIFGVARPKAIKWAGSKAAKPFKSGYYRIKGMNKMSATMRRALKTADDIELHEARMSLGQARNTMTGKIERARSRASSRMGGRVSRAERARLKRQYVKDQAAQAKLYEEMTGVNLAKDLERNEGMFEMDEVLTINGKPLSEYDRLARLEEETFRHDAASIVRLEQRNQESTFIMRDGRPTRVPKESLKPVPLSTAKKIAIGTTIGAIIVGSGYVAYNVAANGITWTRDAMQGVIGGLGDAACWLAHGDHEECKDFVIQDVIVGVNERNETDNDSFFKSNIRLGEDFILE